MFVKLKWWFLTRMLRDVVRQNYNHREKITSLYGCIVVSVRKELNDDNTEVVDNFLHECFEDSLENNT